MNRPQFFQLPAQNPVALAEFYCKLFGWISAPLKGMEDIQVLITGPDNEPGLNGIVMGKHMNYAVNIIIVDQLDQCLALVEEHGGRITTPRQEIPALGSFAWCTDVDGNYFTLMQAGGDLMAVMQESVGGRLPSSPVGRPVHFEIPVVDMQKSAEFYRNVLGWYAQVWQGTIPYTFLMTGTEPVTGIDGAVMPSDGIGTTCSNVIGIDDIDASLTKASELGATTVMPKQFIPEVGHFAYLRDPEGNLFGLMQFLTTVELSPEETMLKVMDLYRVIGQKKQEMYSLIRQSKPYQIQDYILTNRDGSPVHLSALFGKHRELILIHNMGRSCPYCTLWADGFNGLVAHLEDRAAFVVSSPDDPVNMDSFAVERGWVFALVSTKNTTLKRDLGFELEDGSFYPGISILSKDEQGVIWHHGKTYLGPGDDFCALWYLFDMLPTLQPDWEPRFKY